MRRAVGVLFFVSALLCVFGARLIVINRYGSDLPYFDQWGKEADFVIGPLREGNPQWLAGALMPHNEHRIYFTLATDVLLTQFSGQWDARQECVISAALHAIITASLALFAMRRLPQPFGLVAAIFTIAITAMPLVWDNVLWGFQSQFYFLIGFSLLGIDGLLREEFSARWWLGIVAMCCALFSMGSGFLCAVAVLPFLMADAFRRPRRVASVIVAVVVLIIGWLLHFSPPWHASLHARTLAEFFHYAAQCLAWPTPKFPILALLFCSPLAVLAARSRPSTDATHARRFVLGTGAWVLLQIAAVSYARGGGDELPANRYGDVFAIGVISNVFGLVLLRQSISRLTWCFWSGTWLVAVSCAALLALHEAIARDLPQHRTVSREYARSVRDYVHTGDAAIIQTRPIPFPDRAWFQRLLDRRSIRDVLPPSVNESGNVSLLSAFARGVTKGGVILLLVGAVGLFALVFESRRLARER